MQATYSSYESREIESTNKRALALQSLPLCDRREAKADLLEALNNRLDHYLVMAEYVLCGNYGRGPQAIMERSLESSRQNHSALLGLLVAQEEYSCPRREAVSAFKSLSVDRQRLVNESLQRLIDRYRTQE